MAGEIVTRTATHRLGDDGIVRTVMLAGAEETLVDAIANVRAVGTLGAGRRVPQLVDGRWMKSMPREVRAYYAGAEAERNVAAAAVLVGSPVSRTVANFVMQLARPRFPTRLFTDEAAALAWLKAFRK